MAHMLCSLQEINVFEVFLQIDSGTLIKGHVLWSDEAQVEGIHCTDCRHIRRKKVDVCSFDDNILPVRNGGGSRTDGFRRKEEEKYDHQPLA